VTKNDKEIFIERLKRVWTRCLVIKYILNLFLSRSCSKFANILTDRQEFYETAKDMGVEIIFVSSDETPDDMIAYMKVGRGKAMQWALLCRKGAYRIAFGDRGLYFGPKTIFIPPLLKIMFFPPLGTRCFSTAIMAFLP
jgi:hypothetical protein